MNEYNEFISQQAVPPYGGQLTSEWSARVQDERPADPEPSQDTAPAPDEPAADAEASPEEPEPVAEEAQTAQDAESQGVQETAPDAEAQTAQETEPDAEPQAASAAATDAEAQTAEEAEPDTEPQAAEVAPAPDDSEAAEDTGSNVRADLTAEHLVDPGDAERFHSGWREVKAAFVDDPADAVRQASALVGEAVDEVTTALTRLRQDLDRQSQDADQADTERLRQVLRGYGSLLTHILTR